MRIHDDICLAFDRALLLNSLYRFSSTINWTVGVYIPVIKHVLKHEHSANLPMNRFLRFAVAKNHEIWAVYSETPIRPGNIY